ncbi:MAG: hypothetical protein ACK4NR_03400 [Micavibrio sp.]
MSKYTKIAAFVFSLAILSCAQADRAHACSISDAGDHICEGSSPPAPATPPTSPAGSAIPTQTQPVPITNAGQIIDYANAVPEVQQDVQPNLTQTTDPLEAGEQQCVSLAANSTTSIPFVYDGTNAINVADGQGPARVFVSQLPGYDPLKRISPGVSSDYYSPCHAQANIPEICDESWCWPDPYNENSIKMNTPEYVLADPENRSDVCPMVVGETYYLNVQNENGSPINVGVGNGTAGASCAPAYDPYAWLP